MQRHVILLPCLRSFKGKYTKVLNFIFFLSRVVYMGFVMMFQILKVKYLVTSKIQSVNSWLCKQKTSLDIVVSGISFNQI